MKNIDLVTKIVHHMTGDLGIAKDLVQELDEGGFITPDLPEANDPNVFVPYGKGWLPGGPYGPSVWTAPGGTVMVQRIEPGDLTPEETREVADVLYAAAEYSENGKTNESSN